MTLFFSLHRIVITIELLNQSKPSQGRMIEWLKKKSDFFFCTFMAMHRLCTQTFFFIFCGPTRYNGLLVCSLRFLYACLHTAIILFLHFISQLRQPEWSAHAPVNGGPVFPGTFLGHFWLFFLGFFCSESERIMTVCKHA